MTQQIIHYGGVVLQWRDTEKLNYAEPPEYAEVLEVTAEQWLKQDILRWVRDGNLTSIPPDRPGPSLDDLKTAKISEINGACLAAIDGGFEHDGHTYDSDERSKSNIIGTATGVTAGLPLPDGFTWRSHDNQNVPMDGPGVIALGAALLQHVSTQYAISWQLKAEIEAATTPEKLETICWPGPPETPQAA